jgi:uncharacterized protein (DUF169 family)
VNVQAICDVLEGKIRGRPVAVTHFPDGIPDDYEGVRVDPCGILRYAMDEDRVVYFDREHQDCLHGAYITGVHEGNEQIRSGHILTDYIPVYNLDAAHSFNSGRAVLPQGTVKGIGAAPLDAVPAGVEVHWIVVVCKPQWAGMIGAARSVTDGVMPSTAAGNSFCTDAFVTPWYEENVVMTPGDYGGRMNNRLKPEEMFVIIPARYADNLVGILGATPDVKGLYEATRPEDSDYWVKQQARQERAERRQGGGGTATAEKLGLKISMDWEDDALHMIAEAPKFVRRFAVGNVEEFADENGYPCVTVAVVEEQMENAGMGRFKRAAKGAERKNRWWPFGRKD